MYIGYTVHIFRCSYGIYFSLECLITNQKKLWFEKVKRIWNETLWN